MELHSSVAEHLRQQVADKHVLVFGLGIQGGGEQTANVLASLGAHVRVTDQKTAEQLQSAVSQLDPDVETALGGHSSSDIAWADWIIKNPAVPFDHPLMMEAEQQGKVITTETALALSLVRDRVIGITGTRGKTTTTHLVYHLLKTAGLPAVLCGNIPHKPTLSQVLQADAESWFVTEISSFHIEALDRLHLSPKYAVVTNVFPDHLNRYASLEAYARTKAALFVWQQPGDEAFWGTHHDWTQLLAESVQTGVTGHEVTSDWIQEVRTAFPSSLPGEHNVQNIALAVLVAKTFGVTDAVLQQGIASFTGVPYRLQPVGNWKGITFLNDTTSTTPIALEKALEATSQPFILLAGGASKKLPIEPYLLELLRARPVATVWLKGSGTEEILAALGDSKSVVRHETLESALQQAVNLAQQHEAKTIVFSPGFTSFEMFANEFDRGDVFNALVEEIQHSAP